MERPNPRTLLFGQSDRNSVLKFIDQLLHFQSLWTKSCSQTVRAKNGSDPDPLGPGISMANWSGYIAIRGAAQGGGVGPLVEIGQC